MAAPGLLVVLEGLDGAGKTTVLRAAAAALRASGRVVVETREPTSGPLGQRIRALAKEGRRTISAQDEFELFHQDRKSHVEKVVRPALERGAIVLQDRSFFSTVAYQGERGLDRAWLLAESRKVAPDPDLLVIIDLPAETCLERIRARGLADDFEQLESMRRLREVFLGFEGKTVLDGSRPAPSIAGDLTALIEAKLDLRGRPRSG